MQKVDVKQRVRNLFGQFIALADARNPEPLGIFAASALTNVQADGGGTQSLDRWILAHRIKQKVDSDGDGEMEFTPEELAQIKVCVSKMWPTPAVHMPIRLAFDESERAKVERQIPAQEEDIVDKRKTRRAS